MILMRKTENQAACEQRGYAMLGIIAAIGIAATAVVVTSLSATAVRNEQGRKDSNALALAKQALIASAASSNSRPGSLPCPDVDNDGTADYVGNDSTRPCMQRIGRLPWQTLGLPDLRDAAGERLWYAVSLNFQDISANRINANTTGQFNLRDGERNTAGIVAIVAAPGKPVGTQTRDATHINNYENYLESYAASELIVNVLTQDTTHNDQLSIITPADIFSLVQRRVAKEVQVALQNYYSGSTPSRMPYPADAESYDSGTSAYTYPMTVISPPFSTAVTTGYIPSDDVNLTLPTWFSANLWNRVLQYNVDSNCLASAVQTSVGTCGTATFSVQSGGVLIGSNGATVSAGTVAVLTFAGVNAGYTNAASTMLSTAIQVQTQTQTQPY